MEQLTQQRREAWQRFRSPLHSTSCHQIGLFPFQIGHIGVCRSAPIDVVNVSVAMSIYAPRVRATQKHWATGRESRYAPRGDGAEDFRLMERIQQHRIRCAADVIDGRIEPRCADARVDQCGVTGAARPRRDQAIVCLSFRSPLQSVAQRTSAGSEANGIRPSA